MLQNCCVRLCWNFRQFVTGCDHEPKVLDFSAVKEAPPDPVSVKNASVKIGELFVMFKKYLSISVFKAFAPLGDVR